MAQKPRDILNPSFSYHLLVVLRKEYGFRKESAGGGLCVSVSGKNTFMWKDWTIAGLILLVIFLGISLVIQFNNTPIYSTPESPVSIAQPQATPTPVIEKVYVPTTPNNQKLLEACLATAKTDYQTQEQAYTECEAGVGCVVPYTMQPIIDQKYKNDQDTCLKEFPAN